MSEKPIQTVTPKQIRRQFNIVGLAFLITAVLALLAAYGYQWAQPYLEPYFRTVDRQAAELGIQILLTLLITLIPFSICAAVLKVKIGRMFAPCTHEWRNIAALSVIALALYLLLTFVVGVLALFLQYQNITVAKDPILLDGNLAHLTLTLILWLFIYPVCEEFIFRGVCVRVFSRMGNYFAIFASALLYGLMHGNLMSIIPSFFIGAFLAVIAMRYSSILPTIFIHMLLNGLTLTMQLIPNQKAWIIGLLCVVIYALALAAFYHLKSVKIIIRKEADPLLLVRQFFCSWAIVLTVIIYGVLNVLTLRI